MANSGNSNENQTKQHEGDCTSSLGACLVRLRSTNTDQHYVIKGVVIKHTLSGLDSSAARKGLSRTCGCFRRGDPPGCLLLQNALAIAMRVGSRRSLPTISNPEYYTRRRCN